MKKTNKFIHLRIMIIMTLFLLSYSSMAFSSELISNTQNFSFINSSGKTITLNAKSVNDPGSGQCWKYANDLYYKVWNVNFTSSFTGSASTGNNLIRKLNNNQRKLTAANAKTFISAAPVGAVIRICDCTSSCNNWNSDDNSCGHDGHSLFLVDKAKDGSGFTAMERMRDGHGGVCVHKYTWSNFASEKSGYTYFKYIKWPGAKDLNQTETSMSGTYSFIRDDESRYDPNEHSLIINKYKKGSVVTVKASFVNDAGNTWYKLIDDSYVYSGDLEICNDIQCQHSSTTEYTTVNPTCTTNGMKETRCDSCDAILNTEEIPATGHTLGNWIVTREATPDAEGLKEQRCTSCNAVITTETIPTITDSGKCGSYLTWTYHNGLLTISGSGAMYEYEQGTCPWNGYLGSIKKINMAGGTTISAYAFDNGQTGTFFTEVSFPATLTSIGTNAFYNAKNLKEANIPDNVNNIAPSAFRRCKSLQTVHLPSSLTIISASVFWHCDSLTYIEIPETVTSIGSEAFAYTGLANIYVPASVLKIGNGAFKYSSLETAFITSDLSVLGKNAFQNCTNLSSVYTQAMNTVIGEAVFENCPKPIVSCYSDSTFHAYAANEANNCRYVITGGKCGDNVWWSIDGTKLYISGTGPMYDYYKKELPWGNNITSVEVLSGVTTIGRCAFYQCASLTDVTLPETLKSIDSMSFEYCSELGTISIPNGVEQIGPCAFCYDHKLTTVLLPGSVTDIGYAAFSGCDRLAGIILDSTSAYSIYEGALISPDGRLISLFVGNNHTDFTVPQWVTAIDNYAFLRCTSLAEIEIPESVKTIGESAFSSCNSQLTIRCWEATTAHQFALNHNIQYRILDTPLTRPDFRIPNGVKVIDDEAFAGIAAKRIRLPEATKKIGSLAFSNCPNLIEIYIPEGCTSIADDAFAGVSKLTIYGKDGSEAKTFANKHKYGFVIVTNANP